MITAELYGRRRLIMEVIRHYFVGQGFLEVETPCLVESPGLEPHLDPFPVQVHGPDGSIAQHYLHTSPEFAMKRLLARGWPRIFQFARVFRDGERSHTHLPEFTMLEWYRTGEDYSCLMRDCQVFMELAAREIWHGATFDGAFGPLDFGPPFVVKTVRNALRDATGIDFYGHPTTEALRNEALRLGLRVSAQAQAWDDIFFELLLDHVEPGLGSPRPLFLTEYPRSQAALARVKPDDPKVALRFELYAGGLELGNAFDELTDSWEQRMRFEEDNALRLTLGRRPLPVDERLLTSLNSMPPAAGMALGFDRLAMLLLDRRAIGDVVID